jgi:hypothetical protein
VAGRAQRAMGARMRAGTLVAGDISRVPAMGVRGFRQVRRDRTEDTGARTLPFTRRAGMLCLRHLSQGRDP